MRALSRELLSVLAVLACSCTTPAPYIWFSSVPDEKVERLSIIEPGDKVAVVILDHPDISGEYVIGADGSFVQPLAGPTSIGGKTPALAGRYVAERLAPYLQRPSVSVTLVEPHLIRVNVVGEVRTPGTFDVRHDDGLMTLLAQGGGFTDFADRDSIFVVRRDGSLPRIRFRYEDLRRPHQRAVEFQLHDGDTLIIE